MHKLCPAWRDLSLSCNVVSVWEQIPNARRLSRIILVAQGAFIDRTVDVLSPAGLERIDSSIPDMGRTGTPPHGQQSNHMAERRSRKGNNQNEMEGAG